MKKTFLLLYIILINLTPAHSQSTWFWQQPLPTGNFLYAVDFLNENTGYAVGTVGIIMKTTNGGGNWVVQKSGTSSSLTGISIITEENAVISGYNGKILYTTNGGTNWISSASNTTNNLFGVDFPSVNTGYMCGNNGTMLKSTNGGINWNIISSGTTSSIACVSFADTLNGIAGVFRGIMKTTDGGLSWAFTELASQVLDAIVSASFNDVQHAKVLSYSLVYSTSNSGNNWNSYELPLESSNVPRTLSFGNNDTGYISTSFGDIFITTNGGLNWRNDSTFNPVYYQINILWGTFALKNSSTAFVCGAGGSVIRSTNTGNIWTPSTGNRTNLESNFFVNENTGYTVGFDGVILKTTNAGNNWLSQTSNTIQNLNDVFFVNSETGYVCGDSGVVLKTSNGGVNWYMLQSELNSNLNGIFFNDAFTGFIAGSKGKILKTTNSGINWLNLPNGSNIAAILKPIVFINYETGFVAGDQYLKTTNGGNNWTVLSGSGIDIYFPSSLTGYRTGGSGIITKSTNGGINWIVQNGNVSNNLNSIFFINDDNGYAVGDGGAITKTTNGGINWIPQTKISGNDLNSIYFINASTGYISGNFGTILRTTNGGLVFVSSTTGSVPENFSLSQNYPNPFNSSTVIKYEIKEPSEIELKIFNIEGKELITLVREYQFAGSYEILFDASDLNSGIYFYSLFKNNVLTETRKLTLIK